MTVYFISGLGVDHRAFQRIHLPEEIHIVHINWLDPYKKETFADYVKRLSDQIDHTKEFSLVGLSFGGLIAIELAKFLKPKKIILISSLTSKKQLPRLFRIIGLLKLYRLFPARLIKQPNFLVFRLFGLKKEKDKNLLREILKDSSPVFLAWAIDRLLNWKNVHVPVNLIRIHGKNDKLLPHPGAIIQYTIENSGHLMVYTNGNEVSRILRKELE